MNELFSLLERQVRFIREQQDHRIFLALPSLVDFVQTEPRLRAIAEEMALEFEKGLSKFKAAEVRHANEVLSLLDANVCWAGEERLKEAREVLAKLAKQSGQCRDNPLLYRKAETSTADAAISYLTSVFDNLESEGIPAEGKSQYRESVYRLAAIGIECQQSFFEYCHAMTSSPGACWKILKSLSEGLCPTGPELDRDEPFSLERHLQAERFKARMKDAHILLGLDQSTPGKEIGAQRRAKAESALGTFLEAMALRIGIYLSHRGLVMRFKTKCEMFLAEYLRNLADARTNRAEEVLTNQAAQFLFDQGLNPLVNAPIVVLKPDIFDPKLPHALYIEAKQYHDKNPKRMIEEATWQVWDTWNRLDSQHLVREAFLLVFRRSGPLVIFEESVSLAGRTLYPILVDIAATDETGSGAKQKEIHITASQLLPRLGDAGQ